MTSSLSPSASETQTSAGQRTLRPPGIFTALSSGGPYSGSLFLSFLALIFGYMALSSYKRNERELGSWGCRMSWMSPNYFRMDGPTGGDVGGLDKKYGLWLYREGGIQQHTKVSNRRCLYPYRYGDAVI